MRAPENWWRFVGLIFNAAGTFILLWHRERVMWVTSAGGIAVALGISSWPWYTGLICNICGFLLQGVAQFCRRKPLVLPTTPPSVKVTNELVDLAGIDAHIEQARASTAVILDRVDQGAQGGTTNG